MTVSVFAAKQKTIKFAVWDYSMNQEYKMVIAAFEKENPDVKVEPIDIANAQYYSDNTT